MLSCEVDRAHRVTVLRLVGVLNMSTVSDVRTALVKCMVECPPAVVADLSDLTVESPIALSVLGAVVHRAAEWPPVPLAVLVTGPGSAAVIERACRPWRIPVRRSLPDALSATTVSAPVRRVRRTYRPAMTTLAAVRRLVGEACVSWGLGDRTVVAELIMTELASNAVEHARTDLEAAAVLRRDLLHLTVTDGSPDPPRIARAMPSADVTRACGLLLVEDFATAWGYLPVDGGKVVWATLRL